MLERNILEAIYLPEGIYVANWIFDDEKIGIEVTCRVPSSDQYVARPVPYVTTENYVRCLSQASYLLSEHLLKGRLIPLEIPVDVFRQAAMNYELYYRNLAMTFHSRVLRDEEFQMRLTLKNWREIKRLQDYVLFTFTNERTVISGEMSFIFVRG